MQNLAYDPKAQRGTLWSVVQVSQPYVKTGAMYSMSDEVVSWKTIALSLCKVIDMYM